MPECEVLGRPSIATARTSYSVAYHRRDGRRRNSALSMASTYIGIGGQGDRVVVTRDAEIEVLDEAVEDDRAALIVRHLLGAEPLDPEDVVERALDLLANAPKLAQDRIGVGFAPGARLAVHHARHLRGAHVRRVVGEHEDVPALEEGSGRLEMMSTFIVDQTRDRIGKEKRSGLG